MGRFVYYNFADITDHKIFPKRTLHNDGAKFHFIQTDNGKAPKSLTLGENKEVPFDIFLKDSKTVAFLVIKNDTIQYEKYFNGYSQDDIVASFSMAKSVTSILIGCAIDDGLIKSVDDPVIKYIPEMKAPGMDKLTIRHLLQMTSGIRFNESYVNPFGDAAKFYYGRHLRKYVSKMELKDEPGKYFDYKSGDPQVLGLLLERALGGQQTISEYMVEKLWKPLGMEYDATWSLDRKKDGLEKTFCCLNARALDFAKIGRLYLNKGQWNGKQIVSESWVEESTHPDNSAGGVKFYKYQWWFPSRTGDYMAQGILGQYIYVNPEKNLIIVRLGKKSGNVGWGGLLTSLSGLY